MRPPPAPKLSDAPATAGSCCRRWRGSDWAAVAVQLVLYLLQLHATAPATVAATPCSSRRAPSVASRSVRRDHHRPLAYPEDRPAAYLLPATLCGGGWRPHVRHSAAVAGQTMAGPSRARSVRYEVPRWPLSEALSGVTGNAGPRLAAVRSSPLTLRGPQLMPLSRPHPASTVREPEQWGVYATWSIGVYATGSWGLSLIAVLHRRPILDSSRAFPNPREPRAKGAGVAARKA